MTTKKKTKALDVLKESACDCPRCRRMCTVRPCFGTPEEIDRLIDAGAAASLMLEYWQVDERADAFYMVQPATRGSEGGHLAPHNPSGIGCTFHVDDGDAVEGGHLPGGCMLHVSGLKPIEGRLASHDEANMRDGRDLHVEVCMLWNTDEGRAVVERWRKETGCTEAPKRGMSIFDLLDMVIGFARVDLVDAGDDDDVGGPLPF